MSHTKGKVEVYNIVHPDRGGAMTPDEIGKYIADAVRKTIADGGGFTDRFLEIATVDNPQLFICHAGNGPAGLDNAERIKALWNAAEELGLTTEAIEKGVMQMAFAHSHEQGWVIEVALARIKKLEAEKAVMLEVLETAKQFISNGIELGYIHLPEEGDAALETPAIIEAAIRKARDE